MNAVITVSSIQRTEDEEIKTEIITEGTYERTDYGYLLKYDETDATGFNGAHTTLKIFDSARIELTRTGSVSSELLIEPGSKNYCQYGTPYGYITVGILGKEIISGLTMFGGSVESKYVMDVNSCLVGEYDLTISVKTAN